MPVIEIEVRNKVARQTNDETYTCDNSDYNAVFDLDAEWDAYPLKTARFEWNGEFADIVFAGNTCPAPEVHNTSCVKIGVYAGNLRTTTPADVLAKKSILSGDAIPHEAPPEDVYNQIMAELNEEGRWIENTKAEAVTAANEATEAKAAAISSAQAAKDAASAAEADKKLASQHASSASDSQKLASEAANSAAAAKTDAHNDANEAASQARKASSSASAAADSATSAANKASEAASSAENADVSARAAAQREAAAANEASAAAAYAGTAAQAATVAESKASEADASATKAATSESNAASKAAEAADSAKNAAQSKSAAEVSATEAETAAKAAAQSEAAATQSAGNAADAATEAANAVLEEAKQSGEFDGPPGYSPTISIEEITGGHRVIVTDKDGNKQFDVKDGKPGGIQTVNGIEPDENGNVEIETGGVGSWDDLPAPMPTKFLPDGVPYVEEGGMVEILAETTYNSASGNAQYFKKPLGITAGKTYIVTFNGVEYRCKAFTSTISDSDDSAEVTVLGDLSDSLGTHATGEPFGIVEFDAETVAALDLLFYVILEQHISEETIDFTIAISEVSEVIHEIDTRCLPDGVPYLDRSGRGRVLVPETEGTQPDPYDSYFQIPVAPALTDGGMYVVNLNGTDYTCVATVLSDATENNLVFLGNKAFLGGEDTGEPFAIICDLTAGVSNISTNASSVTIAIYEIGVVAHPLDARCLPDAVPYVGEGVLLKEASASSFTHPTFGQIWAIHGGVPILTIGETYTITYNGASYMCVCQAAPAGLISDDNAVAMGNFVLVGGEDTGEPFAMLVSNKFEAIDIIDLVGSSEVKVEIFGYGFHKMDARCLPDDATVFYLTSPNGTKFAVTVDDDGYLTATAV